MNLVSNQIMSGGLSSYEQCPCSWHSDQESPWMSHKLSFKSRTALRSIGVQGLGSGWLSSRNCFRARELLLRVSEQRELLAYERLPLVLKSLGNTVSDTFNYQTRWEQNSFKGVGPVWSLKCGLRRAPTVVAGVLGPRLWLSCASLGSDHLG